MTAIELTTVRSRLKARLDTIAALASRNFSEEPDALPAAPFTIQGQWTVEFDDDMGGGRTYSSRLFVVVGERDAVNGFSELDSYLASSGTKSLKAAVEGSSVGAPVVGDYAQLYRFENVGFVSYRDRTFIGADALIRVASGG